MKLSPLTVFLLLLFFLVISISFHQSISNYFTDDKIPSISKYVFFDSWTNMEGYSDKITDYANEARGISKTKIDSVSKSSPTQLNISPVYDISKVLVSKPVKATLYYDSCGNLINFPKNKKVYDDLGNNILTPSVVGFMADEAGNLLGTEFYDENQKLIKKFSDYTGPVYDIYHNLIYFPYINSSGNYAISSILTPTIYKSYVDYVNGSNKKYTDISCAYGCANFSKSLDDYISDYYKYLWDQNKQNYFNNYILNNDYMLKSSCTNQNKVYDVRHKWDDDDWNNSRGIIGSLGNGLQNTVSTIGKDVQSVASTVGKDVQSVASTVGKDVQAVSSTVGKDVQSVASTVGKDVQSVASTVGKDVQSVASTVGKDIQAVAGAVGSGISSGLSVNPTNINRYYDNDRDNVKNGNNRGLAGNYNGDNTITNKGYLSGTNQFSSSLPAGVANFNNNYNAIPIKDNPSDFLPVTADFSKFGR